MAQTQNNAPVIQVKPQDNVYTALLWIAILVALAAIILMSVNLFSESGYGIEIGDLFSPVGETPPSVGS